MRLLLVPWLVAVSLSLLGCATDKREAGARRPSLQTVVDGLMAEASLLTPGTDMAIAVRDLRTGEYAAAAASVHHISASSAKVLWVAAALKSVGLEQVAPYGEPIFRTSDNEASGAVIDLIGPDAVNDYYRSLGLKGTALTRWNYGRPRKVTNSPRAMGDDNYFTAGDVVDFLARLHRGELLPQRSTEQLLEWMTLTPRAGCGGWLGTMLPPAARASLRHKAGWLPPGCCSDESRYNTLNDVGLVELPGGGRYAVALLAGRGPDWPRQAFFVERASCVLYRTLSGEQGLDCGEALASQGGPAPVQTDGGPPPDYDC